MTPKHFLNGRNRTKFENSNNVEIPGNSVKNGHFRPSKCHKLIILRDNDLKFCTHIHLIKFSHTCCVFLNSIFFFIFWGNNFSLIIFQNIQNFQTFESLRQQFDSTVHPQRPVENRLVLSLQPFAWQRFPQTLMSA